MKWLKYKINIQVNVGTMESPKMEDRLYEKFLSYSEANEEIAKQESYNGEYTIEDDGIEDTITSPTELDKLDARLTYLESMSGTVEG